MRTLDSHLLSLVEEGIIEPGEAVTYAQEPDEMRQNLRNL